MSSNININNGNDDRVYRLSLANIDAFREGVEDTVTCKNEPASFKQTAKAYSKPIINQLGSLSTLIMGQSGAGIDSIARRELF